MAARLLLLTTAALCTACSADRAAPTPSPASNTHARAYDPAIGTYVAFLEKPLAAPVDYIMGLFDQYDVVVICERDHRDVTQYELFLDLVKDPRFAQNVGHVFTELGSSSLQDYVEDFLQTTGLSAEEVKARALHIYRNFSPFLWEKTNFFEFLQQIYDVNRKLPAESRVHLYPSDVPFDWATMTAALWQEFQRTLDRRDRIIADQVINRFSSIRASGKKRRKALVIMNYRHAFAPIAFRDDEDSGDNVGRYLFEAFPGQVANVLLNRDRPLAAASDHVDVETLIQGGKWDASFRVEGDPNVGFDLRGSPFGLDAFDMFPYRPTDAKYQDVFHGFVFWRPLSQHRCKRGIPGLFDDGFEAVYFARQRDFLGKDASTAERTEFAAILSTVREWPCADSRPGDPEWPDGTPNEQIDRWLH